MLTIIIFIIVLSLLVFVHELGHFLTARRLGVAVEEFGFGFPPRIFGVKRGGTMYSINWIPLGGFVKIKGENGDDASEDDSFASKPLLWRIAVILAGVTMNVILAFVLFTAGYMIGVPQSIDTVPAGAIVSNETVRVGQVLADSPAAKAGILPGDIVVTGNGTAAGSADVLRQAIRNGSGELDLMVKRDQVVKDVKITPETLKETGARGIGVELIDVGTIRFPWYLAPLKGAETTLVATWSIISAFWDLIVGIFAGHGLSADVSGPVGIAVITGQAVKIGFMYLVEFTALLSLNLAVINAIPFPALDGGRFLFLIIEALRGRAVSRKIEGIAHQVGFALLMLMILAVTYRDLVRYSGAIGSYLKALL